MDVSKTGKRARELVMIAEFFANRNAAKLARKEAAAAEIMEFVKKHPATKAEIMAQLTVRSAESVAQSLRNAQKIADSLAPARTSAKFYR